MNRSYLLAFVKLVVLIFCVTASSAALSDTGVGAMECSLALVTDSRIVQGQPIILHYRLTNPSSNQGLGVHVGINKTEWYSLGLTDGAGRSASLIPDNRPRKPAGAHRGTFERLLPLASSSGYIVVSQFLAVQHPGRFVLKVHVATPYAAEDADMEDTAHIMADIKKGRMVFTKNFAFPLTILPTNVLALQETANTLRQDFLKKSNADLHDADLEALFSMPEAIAAPVWAALADEAGGSDAIIIARRLSELRSIQASDVLIGMLENPALNRYSKTYITGCINNTYNNADRSLRDHIRAVAADRGITMPQKAEVPTTID